MHKLVFRSKPCYDIIYCIFNILYANHRKIIRVLDLTYGVGRFYRVVEKKYNLFIIGVDIEKHGWEVEPDIFINDTMFAAEKYVNINNIDLIVVDPPWDNYRRGYGLYIKMKKLDRYRNAFLDPKIYIYKALQLSRKYNKTLLYKYYTVLNHGKPLIIVQNIINIFGKKGFNYYVVLK